MGIADIEGIGPVYARKLARIGIRSTGTLLKRGATPKDHGSLVKESGIGGKLILE